MAESVKKANLNRAQKAKALHEKNTKKRSDQAKFIKTVYIKEKDGDLLTDILVKANGFMKYHQKLAQDGVGARKTGHLLTNGAEEVENYFLGTEERVSHLDKAAGLQELVDYIERQTATPEAQDPSA